MSESTGRPALDAALQAWGDANSLLDAHRLRIWDREGLTVTQLRLLFVVSEFDGLSNAELADRLFVTRPSVSALLDRLERGGYLRRDMAANDRRGISIHLEDKGREAVRNLRQEGLQYAVSLFGSLEDATLWEVSNAFEKLFATGRERRMTELNAAATPG